MVHSNPGCPCDLGWLEVPVNSDEVESRVAELQRSQAVAPGKRQAAWHFKALTCIDLTTLAGDDTETNVLQLCAKAANPLSSEILLGLGFDEEVANGKGENRITTAAICIYPTLVPCAANYLKTIGLSHKIAVASVAAGFPSGLYPLESRLLEIKYAVDNGATEIDIVIERGLVLTHQWNKLYSTIKVMKETCGSAHMKTILSAGELGNFENIYKASMIAMMAGSDFIKTSTGKEAVNATLPIGLVMCRAIKDYQKKTGIKVGFKPAGGIRTAKDAVNWLTLIKEELGDDWLNPNLFRFGASGLLGDLEKELHSYVTGKDAPASIVSMIMNL